MSRVAFTKNKWVRHRAFVSDDDLEKLLRVELGDAVPKRATFTICGTHCPRGAWFEWTEAEGPDLPRGRPRRRRP